ncbi:hypothetical protein M7I_1734 [Glarea lozoyensis 74030]|uniref:Uncharacterized protein n=1 Tax=Glarea lozoyensis (strain ATCC 74030 / MF5533) TaxID=1104152 RepID=H0EH01_GLAL7|nr:hypothetical protein M7I_1734 [Glarea lozoyensis 74030]
MLFKFSLLLFSAVAFAATEITIPSDLSDGTWLVDLANPTPDFQFLGELSGNLTGDLLLEDTPEKRWSSGFQPPTDQEISCYKTWLPLHGFRHIRYIAVV